jgi:hypothetical protein
MKAQYTPPLSIGIAGGRLSTSYYFVGLQADNRVLLGPFTLRARQFRCDHPVRLLSVSSEHGIPVRQATAESVLTPLPSSPFAEVARIDLHGPIRIYLFKSTVDE